MKIRTDFVTNSSSSSFVVEIEINLKKGDTVTFTGAGATGETGPIDYFNGEAKIKVSPKHLGISKNVDELIKKLTDGVFDLTWDDEIENEVEIKIFEKSYPVEGEWGETSDAFEFVEEVRSNITSIEEIQSITVSGFKEGVNGEKFKQAYTYDLDNKQYTGIVYGNDFESEGSAGEILLPDLKQCRIEYKEAGEIDDFGKNDDSYSEEDDFDEEDPLEYEELTLDGKWKVGSWKNRITKIVKGIEVKKYIGNDSNVVIPDGVTSIAFNAFEGCADIVKIELPKNLRYIGGWAFKNCTQLQNVVLPSKVSCIGNETFYNCESCKKITFLTNEAIKIQGDAFMFSGIREVEAPNSEMIVVPDSHWLGNISFHTKNGTFSAQELSQRFEDDVKKMKAASKRFNEYPLKKEGVTVIEECLNIKYKNKQIERAIKKFNYKCSVCEATSIDCCIDFGFVTFGGFSYNLVRPFPYYGVKNLKSLSKTIISFLINNGTFDEGFLEDMMNNFDSILNSYTKIDGYVVSCIDIFDDLCQGYNFELKRGKYICKADCRRGW